MLEWDEIVRRAKILVVEDDAGSRKLLERLLEGVGYRNFRSTSDPHLAVEMFREMDPDLVLLDLRMPGVSEFELLEAFAQDSDPRGYAPIMMITGDAMPETKLQALLLGAKDFITKPIDTVEAMLRIRILLETRFKFVELEQELAQLRSARPLRGPIEMTG